ncbi:hypothetical protein VP01_421g2 [Puccinia sorghi]|uniref:Uncharacterized protein n=1 Tax=Puccinia sorghi TaxID=27349 RepID=A0A0L6UQL3_9BASI|nr:hypothetical protein VP01_421g2 [Puccinia sorghi]
MEHNSPQQNIEDWHRFSTYQNVHQLNNENVSDLLTDLHMVDPQIIQSVEANTRKIVELQLGVRRSKERICELKELLTLSSEVNRLKSNLQGEFLHVQTAIDVINTSTNSRLEIVEQFCSQPVVQPVQHGCEPTFFAHSTFSGALKDTNVFGFFHEKHVRTIKRAIC